MRQKEKYICKQKIFVMLYCLFTVVCAVISCVFPESCTQVAQIWYLVTFIIWGALVGVAAALAIKIQKLK